MIDLQASSTYDNNGIQWTILEQNPLTIWVVQISLTITNIDIHFGKNAKNSKKETNGKFGKC